MMRLALLLIFFITASQASFAARDCTGALGSGVQGLCRVLETAVERGRLKSEAAEAFVRETDWSNPFDGAEEGLLTPTFRRAFDLLSAKLSREDQILVKTRITEFLLARNADRDTSDRAKQETKLVFAPEDIFMAQDGRVYRARDELYQTSVEGRPVFVGAFRGEHKGQSWIRVFDPFRSFDRAYKFKVTHEPWLSGDPVAYEKNGQTYLAFIENLQAVNLSLRQDEALTLAEARELRKLPRLHPATGPAEAEIYGSFLEKNGVTFSIPAENFKKVVKFPKRNLSFSVWPQLFKVDGVRYGVVAFDKPDKSEETIYVVNLETGKEQTHYTGNIQLVSVGLTFRHGRPLIYYAGVRNPSEHGLVFIDALTGKTEILPGITNGTQGVGEFIFENRRFLVWPDIIQNKYWFTFFEIDTGEFIRIRSQAILGPTVLSRIIPFVYGEDHFLVIDGTEFSSDTSEMHLIRLTHHD